MNYSYKVTIYGEESGFGAVKGLCGERYISAESAVEAVGIAMAFMGYGSGFPYTSKNQNAENWEDTDNCHTRIGIDGLAGVHAEMSSKSRALIKGWRKNGIDTKTGKPA